MAGVPYTPSAAAAQGPAWPGLVVTDAVSYPTYDPTVATAGAFGLQVQNEILGLIATVYGAGLGSTIISRQAQLSAGPVSIIGLGTVSNGIQSFEVGPADAGQDNPAFAILTTTLQKGVTVTASAGGVFLSALDTRQSYIGAPVYVAVGGGLTLTMPEPEDCEFIQQVGLVSNLSATAYIQGLIRPARLVVQPEEEENGLV